MFPPPRTPSLGTGRQGQVGALTPSSKWRGSKHFQEKSRERFPNPDSPGKTRGAGRPIQGQTLEVSSWPAGPIIPLPNKPLPTLGLSWATRVGREELNVPS